MKQFIFSKPTIDIPLELKAHTSDFKDKESLIEHSNKTLECSISLIESYSGYNVLQNLCEKIYPTKSQEILELFFGSIYLHDIGKINPFFQKYKMGELVSNYDIITNKLKNETYIETECTHHSSLGVLIFIDYYFDKYQDFNDNYLFDNIIKSFAYNILKHHSSFLDDLNVFGSSEFVHYFKYYDFKILKLEDLESLNISETDIDNEYLWYLLKLNYGILTKSDYIETAEYMTNYTHTENVLSSSLKKSLSYNYNKNQKFKNGETNYNYDFNADMCITDLDLSIRNNTNINILRNKMKSEALNNFQKYYDKSIFYLNIPTASGKTNIATSLISKCCGDIDIKKIFYVSPFNKISEQTEDFLVNSLHLNEEDIATITHYSYKELDNLEEKSCYKKDLINMMNNQFLNFPFLLLSHVNFFDIIKGNSKKSNYNLHQLINSVVVLDEIQAYSPKNWSKLAYFIDKYSSVFNIKFIIMSATLPKIDKLIDYKESEFISLIGNTETYFKNENFKDRVHFSGEMLKYNNISFQEILDFVIDKSEKYFNKYNRCGSLIEFIYKKDASSFLKESRQILESYGYTVYLLTSNTLSPRSKKIINEVKSNTHQKLIIICTQCIEAGVDIDMDLGFKDVSLFDSEEQLAGRINRHAKKYDNVLYLFNRGNQRIYMNDLRFDSNYNSSYFEILNTKNFDIVYNEILVKIQKKDNTTLQDSIQHLKKNINHINHQKICDNFQIIDHNPSNKLIFVPVDIPLDDITFNYDDIKNFIIGCFLSGEKVYEHSKYLIDNKRFTELKKFNKIFSIFTTNLFISDRNLVKMIPYMREEKFYYYLEDMNLYSYEGGFDLSRLDDDLSYIFI